MELSIEKQQKQQLKILADRLEVLRAQLRAMQGAFSQGQKNCADEMSRGISSENLANYSLYFESLIHSMANQIEAINQTETEREKWMRMAIQTRNKLKSMDKLRDIQYAQYLAEVKKAEDNEIGDMISFKAAMN